MIPTASPQVNGGATMTSQQLNCRVGRQHRRRGYAPTLPVYLTFDFRNTIVSSWHQDARPFEVHSCLTTLDVNS
jgi:hypothetical protein